MVCVRAIVVGGDEVELCEGTVVVVGVYSMKQWLVVSAICWRRLVGPHSGPEPVNVSVIRIHVRSVEPANTPLVIAPFTSTLCGVTGVDESVSDAVDIRPSAHANCADPSK